MQETPYQSDERLSPVRELAIVAIPAMATMVSYTIMQFIDGYMVSLLGDEQFTAQGNGGMTVFVFFSLFVGTLSVVNTYVSQHLGARHPERTPAYLWNGLWICAAGWVLTLPLIFLMHPLFSLFGHDPEVVRLESVYAQIQIAGGFFMLSARTTGQYFFGLHRASVVLVSSIAANTVNVVANYALIFGKFGMPELGVAGASIGTVLGSMIEFAIPMCIFLGPKMHQSLRTRDTWKPSGRHIKQLIGLGWPAGLQQGNEILCFGLFVTWIVGQLGTLHNAATWVLFKYLHLSFMPIVGLSLAVTAVVGKHIGAGHPSRANHRAWLGVALGMSYMGLFGLVLLVFHEPMFKVFLHGRDTSPEDVEAILTIGASIVIWAVVFQLFDGLGIVMIGALRGAGDTVIPGLVGAVLCWGAMVGLGQLLVVWRGEEWGSRGPWAALALYITLLGLAMGYRWYRGAWRDRHLIEIDDDPSSGEVSQESENPDHPGLA
ncbi:MAG: MATE family efflux transporter [Planctomycetota bacterium]|jgi:MATE family multidrug resistance protein